MTALSAFRDGIRRVNAAPVVVAGMALVTLLIALPLSVALHTTIETHLGSSAAGAAAAGGTDYDWWQEYAAQATGVGTTFTPSIIGFASVLENSSGLLDNRPLAAAIAGVTVAWLVIWSFLSGGILDRYARQRPTRAQGFFAACGTHFWRFLRLGAFSGTAWVVLFGTVHHWIFEVGYVHLTRETTAERVALALRLGAYGLFSALLAVMALLFDYARVRIVVEDRRSAVGSLLAGARFVAGHGGRVSALFLLNAGAFLALVALYGVLAPGAPRDGLHIWVVLAAGQTYIIGRHYLKLLVYASETALFQGSLAHAAYAAAPAAVWPDSPAAESVTRPAAPPACR